MIMNIGKYILAQVIDFIPRYQFDKLVKMYKGDWHAKDLSCYKQLLHLLFGQITGCVSIRDICLCLEAHGSSIYHLGIRKSVNQTYLCRANEKRDYRIYEGLGMYLIGIVRPMYSNIKVAEITIDMSSMRLTPQLSQQALFWLHGHWASIAKAQSKCTHCWIFVEAFRQISILQMENGMTAMNWMRLYLSHLRSI